MTDFYSRALEPGHSGYFSAPAITLDPDLFLPDEHLRPDVRVWLLAVLENGLRRYLDLSGVSEWLHAWLAGSGITYQWSADRGNGDLDVLFGVDMQRFVHWNPDYQGIPERDVADRADRVLRQKLWPQTAHYRPGPGQQEYEATFFWAPGTGSDISRIHPYAAYDLKRDVWIVRPPNVPADPHALYPAEWYEAAGRDTDLAERLVRSHGRLSARLSSSPADSAAWRNAGAELTRVRQDAISLFADIHGGRTEAFGEQGHGYSDWHNFRWQQAKASGVVGGLRAIRDAARRASLAEDKQLYGGPINAPETLLTREALRYGRGR